MFWDHVLHAFREVEIHFVWRLRAWSLYASCKQKLAWYRMCTLNASVLQEAMLLSSSLAFNLQRWSTEQMHAMEHRADACDGAQSRCMRWSTEQMHVMEHRADACDGAQSRCMRWSTQYRCLNHS